MLQRSFTLTSSIITSTCTVLASLPTYCHVNPLEPSVIIRLDFEYSAPYRPNLPFLISDIRALWRSRLSARVPECQKLKTVGQACMTRCNNLRSAEYCDQFVCVCVCLSVREHISGTAGPIFTKFLCRSPVAVVRSCSGGVAICYVLFLFYG